MFFITAFCLSGKILDCVLSPAFCLLRFVSLGTAFCLPRFVYCILPNLKTNTAFCLGGTLPNSFLDCILSQDLIAFCLRLFTAFCLRLFIAFYLRFFTAFCLRLFTTLREDTESIRTDSTVQDDNNMSGNDTDADDADIRPIYDEEPMAEVQLTAECNIFAIGQQHTEQPEIINEGRVDQYPEQCQVKSHMLDSSPDNQTTEYSKQSLESKNILLKKTVAQFQKDFSRMEAHCIALELKYQNQALKSGQHENEHLNKENETLKKHYKDLYDSIKITRSKTIEQTTSLLLIIAANNADLKATLQVVYDVLKLTPFYNAFQVTADAP
ncbi:hypothetical protein Tco_1189599, partial [Tanacetum coccineum]